MVMRRVWDNAIKFDDYGILREAEFLWDRNDFIIHEHLSEIKELFKVSAMYTRNTSVRRYAKDILSCIEYGDEEASGREKFEKNFRILGMRLFRWLQRNSSLLILSPERVMVVETIWKMMNRTFLDEIIESQKDEFCDGVPSETDDDWDSDFHQWDSDSR